MSDGSFHSRVDVRGMLWAYAFPGNLGDNLMAGGNSGEMGKGGGSLLDFNLISSLMERN